MGDHYSMPRIPQTIDNGSFFPAWLEYEDEPFGLVHMGDVVDMYPDMIQGDKASGKILGVEYGPCGELSMLLLSDIRTDERWFDYPGAIYRHREEGE